ncbi:MAG: hypothetical protein ABSE49_28995 [Polyangiaceae bacterium]
MKKKWALVVPAVLAMASCDQPDVHILTGQLYDPGEACVGESNGVDIVQGPSTGDNCNPACLTISAGDATSIYVTTICPPFPGDYSVENPDEAGSASDPCTGAFAAYGAFEDSGAVCAATTDDAGEGGSDDDGGTSGDAAPSDAAPSDAGASDGPTGG